MRIEEAEKYIARKHRDVEVNWIDRGQMNNVAIVGCDYVYKFPKKEADFNLLRKEKNLYDLFNSKVSLKIPEVIGLNEELGFLQISYVGGVTLTPQVASKLTKEQRMNLADKLATFIQEINSPKLRKNIDSILKNDPNDFYYVDSWLKKIAEFCEKHPSELAEKYMSLYFEFREVLPYGFCVGNQIAHKDLHEDNMLFNDNNELVGLIDFAELRYTSIHSEMRTLVRFGIDVVELIIDQIGNLAGSTKALEIFIFAKVYELAVIVQDKYIKKELPWRVDQAKYYLKNWGCI